MAADEVQLEFVQRNLIHNAIKFTPRGGSIRISTVQQPNITWLSINESGVGGGAQRTRKERGGSLSGSTRASYLLIVSQ
ncbi:hypothetical protein [Spirosoma pulveris]